MARETIETDVLLIGAGIMSATLGTLLKLLEPGLNIVVVERLEEAAAESSDAWNNAGTGHSAFCELNYTPELKNGNISTEKAVEIVSAFELSKEFWAYLVKQQLLDNPEQFISRVPHMSVVFGDEHIAFLKKRHEALIRHPLFRGMQYSEERTQLEMWMPLVMKGREMKEKVAATFMPEGTDVNFGAVTRCLLNHLKNHTSARVLLSHEVKKIRKKSGYWNTEARHKGELVRFKSSQVFIGAGGAALTLLEKSRIPEGKGYGGFPVSGQWLICNNPDIIAQHHVKAYGMAAVDAPPMSVPHLDTRYINGKKNLLFGPYAAFTTRFLKQGSILDLFRSLRPGNILPMIRAGLHNLPLTRYLIRQIFQSDHDRLAALKAYMPSAKMGDWELNDAGQRVQIIKKDAEKGGTLQFGTEVVCAADGRLSALLGASPGASVSASVMLSVIEKSFPEKFKSEKWQRTLQTVFPSLSLKDEDHRLIERRRINDAALGLPNIDS